MKVVTFSLLSQWLAVASNAEAVFAYCRCSSEVTYCCRVVIDELAKLGLCTGYFCVFFCLVAIFSVGVAVGLMATVYQLDYSRSPHETQSNASLFLHSCYVTDRQNYCVLQCSNFYERLDVELVRLSDDLQECELKWESFDFIVIIGRCPNLQRLAIEPAYGLNVDAAPWSAWGTGFCITPACQ